MASLTEAALCLPPRPLRNRAGIKLPDGTCDSHLHVFAADAPLAAVRSYTPRPETLAGWLALAESFNIARGIVVQPSVYGLDNSVLLTALAAEPKRLRGVVVIDGTAGDAELARLRRLGVRGIRINLTNKAGIGLEAIEALGPRIARHGWHLQFQVKPNSLDVVAGIGRRTGLTAVIDHLAFMPLDEPGNVLAALRRVLDGGTVLLKITAPYRLRDNTRRDGYREVVAGLAATHPERLLWGSDWPHTELFEAMPEEDDLVALALDALPRHCHETVFVRNPDALYWSD
ncbi:hypothetical protein VE25_11150 [Devosia geojensis]|uniref:Amidohydrolase-related domain-containing protein n=1 Tax=Devosia geojensis TaxID=443610 RepID=A0A0F5FT27_9HYPH|nr:amidohydrolase family protein [Devosia geojensis]KKB11725.1 hypothetical protein VE25_11150 [Devosia geojensis]